MNLTYNIFLSATNNLELVFVYGSASEVDEKIKMLGNNKKTKYPCCILFSGYEENKERYMSEVDNLVFLVSKSVDSRSFAEKNEAIFSDLETIVGNIFNEFAGNINVSGTSKDRFIHKILRKKMLIGTETTCTLEVTIENLILKNNCNNGRF